MCKKINFPNDLPKNSIDIYGRQPVRCPQSFHPLVKTPLTLYHDWSEKATVYDRNDDIFARLDYTKDCSIYLGSQSLSLSL